MDLVTLRDELHRLSTLIDGWNESHEIPDIERDIVLEKLRGLYEAVRFGMDLKPEAQPSAEPAPDADLSSEAIDFDAMIGLDTLSNGSVETETAEPAVEKSTVEAENSSDLAAVTEDIPSHEPEPVEKSDETTLLMTNGEFGAADGQEIPVAGLSEDDAVTVPAAEADSDTAPDQEDVSADAQSGVDDFSPEENAESSEEPVPAVETVAPDAAASEKSDVEIVPEEPSRNEEPNEEPESEQHPEEDGTLSLFDIDSVAVKRAKHRVVMALYGDTPAVGVKKEPAVRPEPAPERPVERPAVGRAAEFVTAGVAATGRKAAPQPEPVEQPAPQMPEQKTAVASATGEEPDVVELPTAVRKSVAAEPLPESAAPVLGELLNADVRTVSDVIASTVSASVIGQEPVTDLHKALCNNDRFLLARDLFNGDMAECERVIDRLNEFEDLDECMIYIAENFEWNPNSDGAKLLVDLLERKLL